MDFPLLDYMGVFLGTFFLFLSIFFVPEIRKSRKWSIIVLIAVILSGSLGVSKVTDDNAEKRRNQGQLGSMALGIQRLQADTMRMVKNAKSDSVRQKEFEGRLFEQFRIIKDSQNRPKQVNYTTNIKKADVVYVGQD